MTNEEIELQEKQDEQKLLTGACRWFVPLIVLALVALALTYWAGHYH